MTSTDLVRVPASAVSAYSQQGLLPSDEALIQRFLNSPSQAKNGDRSRRARQGALRAVGRFLSCSLTEASTDQLRRWLDRPIADATRTSTLSHLHAFYSWAVAEGLIESSPADSFRGVGDRLTLAPTATPMRFEGDRASVELVQVSASVELFRVQLDITAPRCSTCGEEAERVRRLGGVGAPLCSRCYQTAKRAARAAGEALRQCARRTTARDLHSELLNIGLAPRTIRLYSNIIWSAEKWFDTAGQALTRATPEQVAAYAATKPFTHSSRITLRAALRHYWTICGHPRPPVKAIRVPSQPPMTCMALEDDDARILARAARARGDQKGLAVLLGMYEAMRRAEIAALPWDSLAHVEGYVRIIGKGAKTRTIPIHPAVGEALAKVPRSGEYVFAGRYGGPVTPATVWAWVREVSEEAGIGPVRTHWLRHSALSASNDGTGDLRSVQTFAGHARSSTTEGYTRVGKRRLQEAVLAIDY